MTNETPPTSPLNAVLAVGLVALGLALFFAEVPQANQNLLSAIVGAMAGALMPRREK